MGHQACDRPSIKENFDKNQPGKAVGRCVYRENPVCGLISDNRYGFYHAGIPSVLITHQVAVKTGLGGLVDNIARVVFDTNISTGLTNAGYLTLSGNKNLAGELSHPHRIPCTPVKYLGRLSRFEICNRPNEYQFDVVGDSFRA